MYTISTNSDFDSGLVGQAFFRTLTRVRLICPIRTWGLKNSTRSGRNGLESNKSNGKRASIHSLTIDRQWHYTFKTLNWRLYITHLQTFVMQETVTTTHVTKTSSKPLIQTRGLQPLLLIHHYRTPFDSILPPKPIILPLRA